VCEHIQRVEQARIYDSLVVLKYIKIFFSPFFLISWRREEWAFCLKVDEIFFMWAHRF
jgi:hypothetical protein